QRGGGADPCGQHVGMLVRWLAGCLVGTHSRDCARWAKRRRNQSVGRVAAQDGASAPSASSAWVSVFHASVAHLIRTGNFTTPCRASRAPSATSMSFVSSASPFASASSPGIDIRPLKRLTSARTSATVLPFTAWLIIDADDWEIEQPCPFTLTSSTVSPFTWRYTSISSPHNGLWPSAWRAGGTGSSPRLRGER